MGAFGVLPRMWFWECDSKKCDSRELKFRESNFVMFGILGKWELESW